MPATRHSFEEHTGELQMLLEAPTLRDLFAEAGRALAEVMGADPASPASGPAERVQLRSSDRDALLVDWINELIYLSEKRRKLFTEIAIERLTDRELEAVIRGQDAEALATQVKAATFHGLRISQDAGGVSARLVLDV
jgi:SHS2 domain-containing protein